VVEVEGDQSVKMPLFIASAFLTLSSLSPGAAFGAGFRGGAGFHGGGFHSGFVAHSSGHARGSGIHRNFGFRSAQNRRFFHHDHRVFFPQFAWPLYWYPYYSPYDYSYLDDPDDSYQSGGGSAAVVPPDSSGSAAERGPVVVVIKTGNSGPTDSSPNPAYLNSVYSSTDPTGQPKMALPDPNKNTEAQADPRPPVQPPQTAAKGTQTPQGNAGAFANLVLVSWLEEAGKDVIYVQNTETSDVQKITSEPNLDNFRIVKLHPNADPKLFEAVISNGSQQGPVRFHF
jgi:hypothetical protein